MIHLEEQFGYNTVSGAVAGFETNTAHALRQLVVDIRCKQSGSGDPSPDNVRPITGFTGFSIARSGKNLFRRLWFTNRTAAGIQSVRNADGSIHMTGTATNANRYAQSSSFMVLPAGTYTAKGSPNSVTVRQGTTRIDTNGTFESDGITPLNIAVSFVSGNTYDIEERIQIEQGETASDFEPYVGDVFQLLSANIFDGTYESGKIINSNGQTSDNTGHKVTEYIPVHSNATYTLTGTDLHKREPGNDNAAGIRYCFFDSSYTVKHWSDPADTTSDSITFTTGSTTAYVRIQMGIGASDVSVIEDVGTVYGGILNTVTGVLTAEWGMRTIGSLRWYYNETYDRFAATFPDIIEPGSARITPLYCSALLPIDDGRAVGDVPDNSVYAGGTTAHNVYVHGTGYTTEEALKAALPDVQIVYPLREPIEYQLTAQEITTLAGYNAVYADTGDILACEYPISLGDPYENHFSAMQGGNPQHIRVTFIPDNMVFDDKDFTDRIRVTSYMNPDIDLTFGTAYASEVSLQFLRSQKTEQLNWAREFTVEFGVEQGTGTDWVQIGIFSGKRPRSTSRGVIELTGLDRMQRFDRDADDFLALITFPCTLQELFDELCSFVMVEAVAGDEIADVMARTVTEFDRGGISSCRDLLSMIAEANGCYARITPDGYLQFQWFQNHRYDYSLKRDQIFSFETTNLQQFDGKTWGELSAFTWKQLRYLKWKEMYNKVKPFYISHIMASWAADSGAEREEVLQPPEGVQPEPLTWDDADLLTWDEFEGYTWDEAEGDAPDGVIYTIEDNPFLHYDTEQEIRDHLQLLVNRLRHFCMYYVAAISAVGDWIVEAGDVISLEMEDGTEAIYPIFSRTLDWNGFCECEYESTGSINRGDE